MRIYLLLIPIINLVLLYFLYKGLNLEGHKILSWFWGGSNILLPVVLFFSLSFSISSQSNGINIILKRKESKNIINILLSFILFSSIGSVYSINFTSHQNFILILKYETYITIVLYIVIILIVWRSSTRSIREDSYLTLELKKKTLNLIGRGNTGEAINMLLQFYEINYNEVFQELLVLQNQIESAKKMRNRNMMSYEDFSVVNSKITGRVIEIINKNTTANTAESDHAALEYDDQI